MDEDLKKDKLIQILLGMGATLAVGVYVVSGNFKVREWFTFLPPPPPPDTLIYHADAMRQAFQLKEYSIALSQAEWVLLHSKGGLELEATRVRAMCLLRVQRFKDAEKAFRLMVKNNSKDISARLALATALRGMGEDNKARLILLRILKDPSVDTQQFEAARASLNAMDGKEPLFSDQPTPQPYATPGPSPSPSPEPLAPIALNIPGVSPSLSALMASVTQPTPTPQPFWFQPMAPRTVITAPTPEPNVAPVTLTNLRPEPKPKPEPTGTPEPGEIETGELGTPVAPGSATAPLEIPPPKEVSNKPTPAPASETVRRILPATLPTPVPKKKAPAIKKPTSSVKKKPMPTKKKVDSKKKPTSSTKKRS
ncbi:hypothetical protein [Armatimonas sp.]|uniref:tetratricopeptide repeat protein n=1 Tax=Armatimonas sp. TaxID=1872638 RepID=UPI00286BA1D6|nr:hypothetical protein [Armatimonas sp.]